MHDSAEDRVNERNKFAVIVAVLLSAVAVGAWFGLDLLKDDAQRLEELAAAEPPDGAAGLRNGSAKGYWASFDAAGIERRSSTIENHAGPISPSAWNFAGICPISTGVQPRTMA